MFTGHWEWIVILIVALLIFGSRLPSVMRSMGKSIHEFKRGLNEPDEEELRPAERADEEDVGEEEPEDSAD
jgi:sec-independent protein translocase protein TatA